ncbi:MAG: ABC transporter permease [Clostridiales bacterium]|nr:ABC transporter permease [Clostridiales bacterium]
MPLLIGSLQLGLLYALMAAGVYITFRILNVPDLTVDGSFTLGMAVSAVLSAAGHPLLGLAAAAAAGLAAGTVTGLLQTKVGIQPILSGILTMTALYSVNLAIMGSSANVSLIGGQTVFTLIRDRISALDMDAIRLMIALLFAAVVIALLALLFKTQLGLSIRATGDNEEMVRSSSINPDFTKCVGLAAGNACVALSGALITQYQKYADISSGVGMVVVGLASVIIGEALFGRRSVTVGLISAAVGSVIYRLIIALAMKSDLFPAFMLKLVSAVIVALALAIPTIRTRLRDARARRGGPKGGDAAC